MFFVYLVAIAFVACCFIAYFALVKRKRDDAINKLRKEKKDGEMSSGDILAVGLGEKSSENKQKSDEGLEKYDFGEEEKVAVEPARPKPINPIVMKEEKIDISDIDFDALEEMEDDQFDEELKKYSPEMRDAILDELLRRNGM